MEAAAVRPHVSGRYDGLAGRYPHGEHDDDDLLARVDEVREGDMR